MWTPCKRCTISSTRRTTSNSSSSSCSSSNQTWCFSSKTWPSEYRWTPWIPACRTKLPNSSNRPPSTRWWLCSSNYNSSPICTTSNSLATNWLASNSKIHSRPSKPSNCLRTCSCSNLRHSKNQSNRTTSTKVTNRTSSIYNSKDRVPIWDNTSASTRISPSNNPGVQVTNSRQECRIQSNCLSSSNNSNE